MARLSAEEAFGILSTIGKLAQTVDKQAAYIDNQNELIERLKAATEKPPQDPAEGGETQ